MSISLVETIIGDFIFADICKNKLLENKKTVKIDRLTYQVHLVKSDLKESYNLEINEICMIYLAGLRCSANKSYLMDRKDALVFSAWIAYTIKKLHLHNAGFISSNKIDIHLLKTLPFPSKEMMIMLWSESIETFCFDKIEYKHSLHQSYYID